MPIESQDLIIVMKDKSEWTTTKDREHMAELMSEKLNVIPGMNMSFEQPIQMRFNELIAGVKSDIAVKIYGDDLELLFRSGKDVAALIAKVNGATDIKVEQVVGMPQLVVKYDRERIAQYGLNIADLNRVLNTALAGGKAGMVYEGERRYDLVVRMADLRDADTDKVKNILVPLPTGTQMPLGQLAEIGFQSAPAQVSRENGARRLQAEKRAAEAQLRLLQGQIEPHFLFNTLANVSSLMDDDVPRAKVMLESFTDYLRASLGNLRRLDATLGGELDLVGHYLELMKTRMEDRLQYSVHYDPHLRDVTMPPFLLQPLVENALHHGLEPKVEGGSVHISATIDANTLVLEVLDNGMGPDSTRRRPGSGMALANVRERLQAQYGDTASLTLTDANPGMRATMRLPYRPLHAG